MKVRIMNDEWLEIDARLEIDAHEMEVYLQSGETREKLEQSPRWRLTLGDATGFTVRIPNPSESK